MLRDYQQGVKEECLEAWADQDNVACVMPTGAGKTVTMADLVATTDDYTVLIAHREELTGQIAMALARAELPHRIIAPPRVIKGICDMQCEVLGRTWYNPRAPFAVAGIDTLIRRPDEFLEKVEYWHLDEAHHLLEANKWGKGVGMLGHRSRRRRPRGAGWTATPERADGKALRRKKGGLFDAMVVGPTMRTLINRKYLTEYRVFGLPQSIQRAQLSVTGAGEFDAKQLREEAHRSSITGDLVKHYLRLTPGRQAVTFAVDVELAHQHAAAFEAAGVKAQVVWGNMPGDRNKIIRAFERREFQQLINVDLLGEGFDCPGIEVVQMARPTASYPLFVQQFGRALRLLPGKEFGYILDHVGNVRRDGRNKGHGLPDGFRNWSLDGRKKPKEEVLVPVRVCSNPECGLSFEGYETRCPYCAHKPKPEERGGRVPPDMVEGDLTEFTPQMLAELREESDRIMGPPAQLYGKSAIVQRAHENKHAARRGAQMRMREAIAHWAGYWRDAHGQTDSASYRRFYYQFGTDVGTAKTLSAKAAQELCDRVLQDLEKRIGG